MLKFLGSFCRVTFVPFGIRGTSHLSFLYIFWGIRILSFTWGLLLLNLTQIFIFNCDNLKSVPEQVRLFHPFLGGFGNVLCHNWGDLHFNSKEPHIYASETHCFEARGTGLKTPLLKNRWSRTTLSSNPCQKRDCTTLFLIYVFWPKISHISQQSLFLYLLMIFSLFIITVRSNQNLTHLWSIL